MHIEGPELVLADSPFALIDVVDQIIGDQILHLAGIPGVEGGKIGVQQKAGLGFGHNEGPDWTGEEQDGWGVCPSLIAVARQELAIDSRLKNALPAPSRPAT